VVDLDKDVLKSGRNIMDLAGPNCMLEERGKYRKIGIAFDYKQAELTIANKKIADLEAQIKRIKTKKRRSVPNPNRRFIQLSEILGGKKEAGNALTQNSETVEEELGGEIEVMGDSVDEEEVAEIDLPAEVRTRSGRSTRIPKRYTI
jgi:hypothetical protein